MPAPQGNLDREQFSAGILRIYLYFRVLLALILFGTFVAGLTNHVFGLRFSELFLSVAAIYVAVAAITLGFFQLQRHYLSKKQVFFTLLADILIQTLLMFCSGGLSSGLGYLMLVTVAVGAIFFTGQLALLIPAIASIGIILESIVGSSVFDRDSIDVFPAGILGVLLFASSLIFTKLSNALVDAQHVIKTTTALSAGLQELNQMIIDRMRTGIIVVDGGSTIQQINTAARELLGRRDPANPLVIGDKINGETRLVKRLSLWKDHPDIKPKPFIPRIGSSELQANFATLETKG
jgi:two-component system, NtrC family, sensor histidine kinase PilS